ncbi:MAG: ribosomal RNA small subunit methyltransferase I [bacterium]
MSNLYILATPIGNLEDISLRALRILREVDFIICEDTRVTAKLLSHFEIKKPLISYHQHTHLQKINYIIERLAKGENAALVSDAGTPGISDPGGVLVDEILKRNTSPQPSPSKGEGAHFPLLAKDGVGEVNIIPIPGANAAVTLASVAGIPMDKFLFLGFPPHKKGRQTFFKKVLESDMPVIFYESCHRILKALGELRSALETHVIVGRELTKMFETIYRGSVEDVIKELESDKNNLKGEFTAILYKK